MESGRKKRGPYGKRKIDETNEGDLTFVHEDIQVEKLAYPAESENFIMEKEDNVANNGNRIRVDVVTEDSPGPSRIQSDTPDSVSDRSETELIFESFTEDFHDTCNEATVSDRSETEQIFESFTDFHDTCNEATTTDSISTFISLFEEEEALTIDTLLEDTLIGTSSIFSDLDGDFDDPLTISSEDIDEDMMNSSDLIDDDVDSKPLYEGASVTVGAFMLLLAIFSSKYNLIGEGVQQLLNIISLALPKTNRLCTSLHSFKMFFKNLRHPLVRHYYCTFCLAYIDSSVSECPICKKDTKTNKQYFLEMPIADQIKNLFSQEGFYESLQGRFQRNADQKKGDIYDGSIYKSLFDNNGPLSNPANLSFVMNTDGAPVFKSSKVSIWPIFLVINELPYKLRMRKENMILAALWFGNQKPAMGTFLKPLAHSLQILRNGIECSTPDNSKMLTKCFLLAITADLPARSMVCNSVQFNGAFGCWKCLQRGETAAVGKGHTHVFPYDTANPKGPKRTPQSVQADAAQALDRSRSQSHINGVKGSSWMSKFPFFNTIDGIAIDYMHGVLLGVQKLLLTLWFSQKHKSKDYNVCSMTDDADKMMSLIQPTLDITRLPRSVSDLKYWKASEYRSFLLFYGCPIMCSILDKERFNHYACLVNAMHILLSDRFEHENINRAERMLLAFCNDFEKLYARCYMTLNVHQLVHLADCVRCLGPLYTHSCFPYEDKNGLILKLIRGTQNIDNQIITGVSFIQKIPELKQTCVTKGSKEETLCNNMENPHVMKRGEKIGKDTYILGATKKRQLCESEFVLVCEFCEMTYLDDVASFARIEKDGSLIYSKSYSRMIKRDNSAVSYKSDDSQAVNFGIVINFLLIEKSDEQIPVAIVQKLACPRNDDKVNILVVKESREREVVPVHNIKKSCMLINTGGEQLYICRFPNKLESD